MCCLMNTFYISEVEELENIKCSVELLRYCYALIKNHQHSMCVCVSSIDGLTIPSRCGKGQLKRVSEVFDCWFESGSMPYAQAHYPFENRREFEDTFPADFIAEGIDQTRGW